jgi:two-component system sensor histidine kinase ChiS
VKAFSLATRIAIIILGAGLVTVLALTGTAYRSLTTDFEELLTAQQARETEHLAQQVDKNLQIRTHALESFAASLTNGEALVPLQQLEHLLGRQEKLSQLFPAGLVVFDENATAVAESIHVPGRLGTNYRDRPHFQRAFRTRQSVVSRPIIGRTTGLPLLSFVALIESDSGDLLGFAGGILNLSETSILPASVTNPRTRTDAYTRVIDTDNALFVDSRAGGMRLLELPPPGTNPLIDAAMSGVTFGLARGPEGRQWIYATDQLQRLGWLFLRAVPHESAVAPATRSYRLFLAISLVLAVLISLLAYSLARGTIAPLSRMTRQILAMARNPDHKTTLDEEGSLEIRQLAQAFNAMMREREALAAVKNDFVATVSHELRTPLTSLHGSLKLLDSGAVGDLPTQARELGRIALRNSERLRRLIDDLLDFNKLMAGRMEIRRIAASTEELVQEAIEGNQSLATHGGVRLVADSPVDIPVLCDPMRTRQILDNLITNAIRYSPEGGTVTVTVKQSDGQALLTVSDQGPGVPEDFRERLFERFAQAERGTQRSVSGTGLGLAICKELIILMDGHIGHYNDNGAHFWITLPLATIQGEDVSTEQSP